MMGEILRLSEHADAHGTERLIQEQRDRGYVEIVYRLGDAGGYYGVVDYIGIVEDHEGDLHLSTATDASDYHATLDEAVAAARRQLERTDD